MASPISIGARPVTSCPNGLGVAACATRVRDHLRRRLRKPDRRLRYLALPFRQVGHRPASLLRRRGLCETPEGSVNPTAQSTRRRTGFRGAEQGARSASPMPLEAAVRPAAGVEDRAVRLDPRRAAPEAPSSPPRSVENARAGTKVASKNCSQRGERLRCVMRRTFRRITHFSKNEHPSSTSLSGPRCFRPRAGECRAS